MNQYIDQWLRVIDGMNNTNTYKLAWGRALVELCHFYTLSDELDVTFSFDQISEKMFKYYWNQTFFFNLHQGPSNRKPVIQQVTEQAIERYQEIVSSRQPVWFDKCKDVLIESGDYQRFIDQISKTLTVDVSWRFLVVGEIEYPLYRLDKTKMVITFNKNEVHSLQEYSFILSQLFNYRWAQLLEKFNQSPRIVLKVKGSSEEKVRRNNLRRFKEALLAQYPDGNVKDFYSGEIIEPDDISIDHVLPWSFMYSDDIWNLVITSKGRNSSKSNSIVSEEIIEKLKRRNEELINFVPDSLKRDLIDEMEHNYLSKLYYQFRM